MTRNASYRHQLLQLLWNHPDARRAMTLLEVDSDSDKADALQTVLHWATIVDTDMCRTYADEVGHARGAVYDAKYRLKQQMRKLQAQIDSLS